jgi:hypothetical protein
MWKETCKGIRMSIFVWIVSSVAHSHRAPLIQQWPCNLSVHKDQHGNIISTPNNQINPIGNQENLVEINYWEFKPNPITQCYHSWKDEQINGTILAHRGQ